MRILVAHNRYQLAGGEDQVVRAEMRMLESRNHPVELLAFDNENIVSIGSKLSAAANTFFSSASMERASKVLETFRPDVLHVHNFMPVMSPSIFFAAERARVPVVLTLHNYRIFCASATMFRNGTVCESCLERRSMIPGIVHACYRNSRLGSAIVGGSMMVQDWVGTWKHRIHRFIALTHFAANKLSSWRLPAERLVVKPNFTLDSGEGDGAGNYALFVGRLSPEKGIATLLAADASGRLTLPVHIVGEGPLVDDVKRAAARPESLLVYQGKRNADEVREAMKSASVLLLPSLWYEGFPMVLVEALSTGLPAIASNIGGMPEIVQTGVNGLLHASGSPDDLRHQIATFASFTPAERNHLRKGARSKFLAEFTEPVNYHILAKIYAEARDALQT